MTTHGRVDANQAEIVDALRKAGCSVQSLASVGNGCPDLLVKNRHGWMFLLEVKMPGAKLNKREQKWHDAWGWYVDIVHSAEEALEAVEH